jgi:ribosomal protein S18 acetylase RimI-like enzyme
VGTGADPQAIQVADLPRSQIPDAVALLARGMRDNPLHVAAFGPDPERRRRSLERLFRALFRVMVLQTPLGAHRDGILVGATGIAPPATCQPAALQQFRLLSPILGLGPRASGRVMRWLAAWSARDPDERHSHLGPLAVDAHLQGQGIGTRILAEYCGRLDRAGEIGYLETDRPENVRLYERHGFTVIGTETVIGVDNWFMRRDPQRAEPRRSEPIAP